MPVANFRLRIHGSPNEVPDPILFREDREHAAYDPEYAQRSWRMLVQADRVFKQLRAGFLGKVNPVHFFWGSFGHAVTRFSGRGGRRLTKAKPEVAWTPSGGASVPDDSGSLRLLLAAAASPHTESEGTSMKIDLSGRTVTGSTAGIGLATARGLAEAGAAMVVNGRRQATVDAAVTSLKSAPGGAPTSVASPPMSDGGRLRSAARSRAVHRHPHQQCRHLRFARLLRDRG